MQGNSPRMLARLLLVVSCVAAPVLHWRAAAAEGDTTRPFWDAPSGCPAPNASAAPSVRVTVRQQQGRWFARIKDSRAQGDERLLVGDSCDEVTRAVVVTLSLLSPRAEATSKFAPAARSDASLAPSGEAPQPFGEPLAAAPPQSGQSSSNSAAAGAANPNAPNLGAPNPPPSDTGANDLSSPAPSTLQGTAPIAPPESHAQPVSAPQAEAREQDGLSPPGSSVEVAPAAKICGALLGGALQDGAELWSVGGALSVAGDWPRWTLSGDLRLALGAVDSGVRLELQRVGVGLSACKRWDDQLTLLLCAGVGLDVLRGVAPDIARPSADASLLPGGAVQLLLRAPIATRVGVLMALGAHGRVRGAQFAVEPTGVVYTFPRTGFSLLAGPELEF